jgi:hypothetical protein
MPPVSRLGRQLQEAIACLERAGSSAALIGGLALARYDVIRATHDVDLLYASRPAARHLLDTAVGYQTPLGPVRVVGLEGLIAFKLQGLVNDPRRTQDLEDMRALLRANRDRVNLSELR